MDNIRIMFLRGANNHPVGCLAMKIVGQDVQYQVSTLNPVDKFNRKVARQLAIGRLVESGVKIKVSRQNIHEVVRVVMQHLSLNESVPARSRRSAQIWLRETPVGSELMDL